MRQTKSYPSLWTPAASQGRQPLGRSEGGRISIEAGQIIKQQQQREKPMKKKKIQSENSTAQSDNGVLRGANAHQFSPAVVVESSNHPLQLQWNRRAIISHLYR
ncbi:hypothetical protein PoB_006109300 [Plakobranchus ocellatus]|uniref:Uncharacterized protein n=1 Tax=Plakobranchus ocellatus TaxID=259542 RepID=A0AAV4CRP9_9GAST|nr:hypothetical protein PoB_006109300 [Plakobranchus ocellatus]